MAVLSKGHTFADGDDVTSTKANNLVDQATFVSGASGTTDDSTLEVNGSGRLQVKDSGITTGKIGASAVTTAKLANSTTTTDGVTFSKIRYIDNLKVIGNVSGGATTPSEVSILDEDNMSSNSATSLATQQSIKAYVDSGGAGFSPSTYAGGENTTLPNGMIFKAGQVSVAATTAGTITFGAAFPNGIVSVVATTVEDTNNDRNTVKIGTQSASSFTLRNTAGLTLDFNWIAIGY